MKTRLPVNTLTENPLSQIITLGQLSIEEANDNHLETTYPLSLLSMSESRQVNRGRSATDVKGAWLR